MSKRLNVVVSDYMNERLDQYSERYGMSKSSIVGFLLGQWIDNMDKMNKAVYGDEGFIREVIKEAVKAEEKLEK